MVSGLSLRELFPRPVGGSNWPPWRTSAAVWAWWDPLNPGSVAWWRLDPPDRKETCQARHQQHFLHWRSRSCHDDCHWTIWEDIIFLIIVFFFWDPISALWPTDPWPSPQTEVQFPKTVWVTCRRSINRISPRGMNVSERRAYWPDLGKHETHANLQTPEPVATPAPRHMQTALWTHQSPSGWFWCKIRTRRIGRANIRSRQTECK